MPSEMFLERARMNADAIIKRLAGSNQLALSPQHGFQFLDSFGFNIKNQFMFHIGQSCQIFRAIITANPIKMMNHPSFRQRAVVSFLPDHYMLLDVAIFLSPMMIWVANKYVSIRNNSTTLPMRCINSSSLLWYKVIFTRSPRMFLRATSAKLSMVTDYLPAIRARMLMVFTILFFVLFSLHVSIIALSRHYRNYSIKEGHSWN